MTPREHGSGFLGTGLPGAWLAGILVLQVVVFLFWNRALWRAPTGSSHVGRIAVSYLIALPAVAILLLAAKRWSWAGFAGSVGLVWAAKLVLTASLYAVLASGSASHYVPARAWEETRPGTALRPDQGYRAARAPRDLSDLSGTVVEAGVPVAGAIVVVEQPPPGLELPPARDLEWVIRGGRHDQLGRLARQGDRISVSNRDSVLHTVRFTSAGRALWNVPVPPGTAPQALRVPAPGVYDLSCESHAGEQALLVVVDHPYAVSSDAAGRFVLSGVPAGARELRAFQPSRPSSGQPVLLSPGRRLEVRIELGAVGDDHGGDE